jgi:CheY-like chemotaxis protein
MTAALECLFVDDNEDDLNDFSSYLREAWDALGTGIELHITTRSSQQEGLREIRENGSAYRLFVFDLLYREGPAGEEKAMFVPLFEAANRVPRTVRMALTAEQRPGNRPRVEDLGASAYIVKDDVVAGGAVEYLSKVLRRLRPQLVSLDDTLGKKLTVSEDVDLLAVTEQVGRGEIISLLEEILERPVQAATASYVAPGYSGAAVLRLDCKLEEAGGSIARVLLLKMSRDRGRLLEEVEKIPLARQLPEGRVIRLEGDRIAESGGWNAIALSFRSRAETLHSWLQRPQEAKEVDRCLTQLFLDDGFAQLYRRREILLEVRPSVAMWRCLPQSRRARIRQALREVWPLVAAHWPAGVNEDIVARFLSEARRVGDLDEESFARGTAYCWCHGDLHSRNILVDRSSNPLVIDFANCQSMPWPMDVARLVVDLVLSCVDSGVLSHEWTELPMWVEGADAILSRSFQGVMFGGARNGTTSAAIEWIQRKSAEIFGDGWVGTEWQFTLALAVEFLRGTYRDNLPGPKKALAAIAAVHGIEKAAVQFTGVVRDNLPAV